MKLPFLSRLVGFAALALIAFALPQSDLASTASRAADEIGQSAFDRKADKWLKHIYRLTASEVRAGSAPESIAARPELAPLKKFTGIKDRGDGVTRIGVMVRLGEGNEREIKELNNAGFETGARIGDIVSVETTPERLPLLATLSSVRALQATRLYHKANDRARQAVGIDNLSGQRVVSQTGKGVVVGIIDTGIDFRHGDFLVPGTATTRVKALWDITDSRNDFVLPGTTRKNGHTYSEADINSALANPSNTTIVQEKDNDGHGTHIAGTAAGNGRGGTAPPGLYAGMAPEADLVIVKAGNGSYSDDDIADGLEFIRQRAAALNEPFVINLSLGEQIGPHDGTLPLERAIDTIVGSGPGRAVCVGAGNEGADASHARGVVPTGSSLTLNFNVISNPMTIDLYAPASDHYAVTVTSPTGVVLGPVTYSGNGGFAGPQASNSLIDIYNTNDNKGDTDPSNDQPDIFIVFKQNAPGNWTIQLQDTDSNPNSSFDAWAQGSKVSFTNNADNNSHLVSSPATARGAIAVGSYVTRSPSLPVGSFTPYTNPGPTADGRLKPEIAAPGSYLYSTRSADSAQSVFTYGTGSDAVANNDTQHYGGLAGTSISTPVVAGSIALILQANPMLSANQIRDYLTSFAKKDNFTNADPPNGLTNNPNWTPHFGFGKLDLPPIINVITGSTPNTQTGNNVTVPSGNAGVTFSNVSQAGTTTFTPINPNSAGAPPKGFTIATNGPAYDITTTATYTPPIDVCFTVTSVNDATAFSKLRILHGENGVLVDRTFRQDFGARQICARVSSLSPFVLAMTDTPFANATSQLLNISTRMRVLADDKVLIGGFIITGTDLKRVIIRGIGPSLSGVGVTLSDPTLELHRPDGTVITNDNWKVNDQTGQSQEADVRATTVPPANDLESAIVATLPPDNYTAIVRGKNNTTGVGLVEVYNLQ